MCKIFVLIIKVTYIFFIFRYFHFSGQNDKSLCDRCLCLRSTSTCRNVDLYILIGGIYPLSPLNVVIFHLKTSIGNFCDIAHPHRLFISHSMKMMILCLIQNLSSICYWVLDAIPSLIPFSTISHKLTSVNSSNSTPASFSAAFHTYPSVETK